MSNNFNSLFDEEPEENKEIKELKQKRQSTPSNKGTRQSKKTPKETIGELHFDTFVSMYDRIMRQLRNKADKHEGGETWKFLEKVDNLKYFLENGKNKKD